MRLEDRPSQPADTQIERQIEWAPYIIPEKDIRLSDAYRSSSTLLKGLRDLHITLAQPGSLRVFKSVKKDDVIPLIMEISSSNSRNTDEQKPISDTSARIINHILRRISTAIPSSVLLYAPFLNSGIIEDHTAKPRFGSISIFEADMEFANQQFRLAVCKEQEEQFTYDLSIAIPTSIPKNKEVSLDLLPLNFMSVGFRYDFHRNPSHRERVSEFYERVVDMYMVSKDPDKKSVIFGHQTPNGINAVSMLHLQPPNPSNHLKCYEVELKGPNETTNLDNTTEIVPESHWQEEERHYCMTGDEETLTYPLFPIKGLGKIATLSMEIYYHDKSADSERIHKLLQGFPLSINGANQCFATGYLGEGNIELLINPEWGNDNARLVYRQQAKKRISPEEIHTAAVGMNTLKQALTERLAA